MPGAAKMLTERDHDRAYLLHKRRVVDMEAKVDNSPPQQFPHLHLRLKQLQLEESRKAEIDRENKLLLKRMTEIMMSRDTSPGAQGPRRHVPGRRGNAWYRDREQDRIMRENLFIAQRIERTRPIYRTDQWEADYQHRQHLMRTWRKNPKRHGPARPPGRDEEEQDGNYESDFESDSDGGKDKEGKKRNKLPPIKTEPGRGNQGHWSKGHRGSHSPRDREGHDRKGEHKSPNRDLWMYYGLRPRGSDDEEENRSPREEKKKGKQNQKEDARENADRQAESDAKDLFRVAKELAPPHTIIIRTLARKSFRQRMKTKDKFRDIYDLDLETELKKGLGSEWSVLVEALLTDQNEGQSEGARKALKNGDAVALVKKVTPLSNRELGTLKEEYFKENSSSLESDITKKYKDPVQLFLLTLVKGARDDAADVNDKAAEQDARALHEFGEGRWTSDKGKFILLLEEKSTPHMRNVFRHYKHVKRGKPAARAVQDECPKDYAQVLTAYISCTESAGFETADSLHANLDPSNPVFVKTLVARSETDMPRIRKDYKKKYGTDLSEAMEARSAHTTVPVLRELIMKRPKAKGKKGQTEKQGNETQRSDTDGQNERKEREKEKEERFDAAEDAKRLHEAVQGLGTDENTIVSILPNRSNAERQEIRGKYQELYKKDLVKDLRSDLSGDLEEVTLALMMPPVEYEAHCLHQAMKGLGTDETVLIGILCSKPGGELEQIKKTYKKAYKKDLEADIKGDTSGDFRDLLLQLTSGQKGKGGGSSKDKAKENARAIHDNSSADVLRQIFTKSSQAQIKETAAAHRELFDEDLAESIRRASSGDSEAAYLAIVSSQQDLVTFYAERVHSAVKGVGTNDTQLIRILVSRSEVDLPAIQSRYRPLYGTGLRDDVEQDTSGDYRQMLLNILDRAGPDHSDNGQQQDSTKAEKQDAKPSKPSESTRAARANATKAQKKEEVRGQKEQNDKTRKDNKDERRSKEEQHSKTETHPKDDKGTRKDVNAKEDREIGRKNAKEESSENKNKDGGEHKKSKETSNTSQDQRSADDNGDRSETTKNDKSSDNDDKDDDEDAKRLYRAMKGLGTDEDAIINIITSASNADRQKIKERYQELYKKDLMEDLRSDLSGDLEEVTLALMMPPVEYEAHCLHQAMKGLGTDETILIGILCSKPSGELENIKKTYKKAYKEDLEKAIQGETSGEFGDLMVRLARGQRGQGTEVDTDKAERDARALHDGSTQAERTELFASSSPAQLQALADAHQKLYSHDVVDAIRQATSGDAESAYVALVKASRDQTAFYTERLHDALSGLGTNDTQLIRLLVSRAEIDLPDIIISYQKAYGSPLRRDVEADTSGHYKKTLLNIIDKSTT